MNSYVEQLEDRIDQLEVELESCEARVGSLRMLEDYLKSLRVADEVPWEAKQVCYDVINYISEVKDIKKLERKRKKLKHGRYVSKESKEALREASRRKHDLGILYSEVKQLQSK
jgi:hypothetical protein